MAIDSYADTQMNKAEAANPLLNNHYLTVTYTNTVYLAIDTTQRCALPLCVILGVT